MKSLMQELEARKFSYLFFTIIFLFFIHIKFGPIKKKIYKNYRAYKNLCLHLLGSTKNQHGIIVSDWLNGLNEQTKKLATVSSRNGFKITFERISDKSRTPKLTKLRAEMTPTGKSLDHHTFLQGMI